MPAEFGAIGRYGIRGIIENGRLIAVVPLPPQGMTNTIDERRAERDATAERIVAALNAYEGK